MTPRAQALQKFYNALKAYQGTKIKMSDGKLLTYNLPQKSAFL
jgi:hypothetical protein